MKSSFLIKIYKIYLHFGAIILIKLFTIIQLIWLNYYQKNKFNQKTFIDLTALIAIYICSKYY